MLKFFRTIRNKFIEQDNVLIYLHYTVGEFLQTLIGISESRPVRDEIWVEMKSASIPLCRRYSICRDVSNNLGTIKNHIACPGTKHKWRYNG